MKVFACIVPPPQKLWQDGNSWVAAENPPLDQWSVLQIGPTVEHRYELPGGEVHEGELPDTALVRCVAQQTGLIVTVGPRLLRFSEMREILLFLCHRAATQPGGVTAKMRQYSLARFVEDEVRGASNARCTALATAFIVQGKPEVRPSEEGLAGLSPVTYTWGMRDVQLLDPFAPRQAFSWHANAHWLTRIVDSARDAVGVG